MATGSNDDLQALHHDLQALHLEGLDLNQMREIGRGAYGAVYEVKMNGLPCIAKGLHQILLGMGGYERVGEKDVGTIRAKFLQECSLLSKLKHPNIVQFLGIHHTKEDDLLVMEYMHMDLAKCLEKHPDILLPLKLSILLDVSCGLLHLHSQTPPIIHRDLTAANVLLTEGLRAKIADLGVSKIFDLQQIQRVTHTAAPGTHAYMPPEALSPTPHYGTKLDSFSFGVLSLYTANQEFPSVHEPPMTTSIFQKGEVQIFKRKHWIDKMGENHTLYPLVIRCLQDRPDQRPSAKELSDMLSGLCTQHPKKWETILELEKQIATLQGDLMTQEQKTTELNKLLQDALLKTQSVQKELTDEMTRISEESNTALHNAAKKYALEKGELQAETELYRAQATMYQEDFAHERKDRENLHGRLTQKEEVLAKKEVELTNMKQQFEEELQTKNQQVKQYKRQVDAVKADLDKCQMELNQVTAVSSAMLNYRHLFKLLVFYESREEQSEKEHMKMWSAKLSPHARDLLLTEAVSSGLSDLQCIAIELSALMKYHKSYTVQWGAFLSLVERIESNLLATSSPGKPSPLVGSDKNWPPELQHKLMDLHMCIKDQLCAHLYVLATRSGGDLKEQLTIKEELIDVLQTLQKLYKLQPFAAVSSGTVEECIRTSTEEWFVNLSSSLCNSKDSKASALKIQAETCMNTCHAVQKHIVMAVSKEFGVSYYSIFIQVIGAKLSELCQFCISEEKSSPLDKATSILYYRAYQACRQIEKYASMADPTVLETLNIWMCYQPVVGSWIETACIICKERMKEAVASDQIVKVTEGAYHSSSAVDVAVFLNQSVTFWKSLNWPDAEQAFCYALVHFENLCHCIEDYAKTICKRLNAEDLTGQSFEVEKVCIVFNNMAHLFNQLNPLFEKLDMDSLYTRLGQKQSEAKKFFDRLMESTKDGIEHMIVTVMEEYSMTLAPDIRTFIATIMVTGHETRVSLEALRDHLNQSLRAFGDYLPGEVFQIILACVWSTTLKCFKAVLPDIQKGVMGQVQGNNLHQAVLILRNFFAEGNFLTGKNLENALYKHLLTELECKCLSTRDLVFKCCTKLSQCQPQSSTVGELSISVQYVEESSVLEVKVLTARLLNGTKKDGSADTIVQVWMMPQMALQGTKTSYKTDLKKGTLTPKYDKEFQIPAKAEDLKRDGTLLALAVYHTDNECNAGLCLVPCQDIPVLQGQESCASKERVLPLFVIQNTNSVPLKELLMRQAAHDQEAANFYKYLDKKLHVMFRSSPS